MRKALLFREVDFQSPERSRVFRQLWALPDAEARSLVGRLFLAAQRPLIETPLLGDVLSNGSVVPLSGEEERQVESALRHTLVVAQPSAVPSPEAASSEAKRPWWAAGPPPLPAGQAGEGNVILHDFLRLAALAVLVGLAFVGVWMAPKWLGNTRALSTPEEPGVPPLPTLRRKPIAAQATEPGNSLQVGVSVENAERANGAGASVVSSSWTPPVVRRAVRPYRGVLE